MVGDAAATIWRALEPKLSGYSASASISLHVEGGHAKRDYTLYRCEPEDGERKRDRRDRIADRRDRRAREQDAEVPLR